MSAHSWSVPETDVLDRARELAESDRRAVLATIVAVEGSAYRRPGAKMVITEDGDGVGHVTAGCLESEVVELAGEVLDADEPRLVTYDLMEDDDDVWGLGVGCNGVITVLLEPLDEAFAQAVETVANRERVAAVSLLDGDSVAARAYYRLDDGFDRAIPDTVAGADDRIADLLTSGRSGTVDDVFVDSLVPPPRALLLGTGNDVAPMVDLAKKADFHVTVAGFRGARASHERFPGADDVVSTSPTRLAEDVDVDENTYAVAMTHNFVDDRLALESLLDTPTPYVGLLGPRKRFEEMREAFDEEGTTFDAADLERVYTPVGLDLGGGTPYQIANSVVAELLAVVNEREPRHLREREGPIHERTG